MGAFYQHTYEGIAEEFERTTAWLEGLGVEVRGGRMDEIALRVGEICAAAPGLAVDEFTRRFIDDDKFWFASVEALGLNRFFRAFAGRPRRSLPLESLRRASSTAAVAAPSAERRTAPATSDARNILFELELATDFGRDNLEVTHFDDFGFRFEDVAFDVQCKRLLSPNQMTSNDRVRDAYRQLVDRFSGQDSRGLVALRLDRVIETDSRVCYLPKGRTPQDEAFDLARAFDPFLRDIRAEIDDPRVLGFLYYITFPCISGSAGATRALPTYAHNTVVRAFETIPSIDWDRLKRLVLCLGG
ncbi:MAG: hypothetical protein ABI609_00565 [Acidobacteriota bacterium]